MTKKMNQRSLVQDAGAARLCGTRSLRLLTSDVNDGFSHVATAGFLAEGSARLGPRVLVNVPGVWTEGGRKHKQGRHVAVSGCT